MVMNSKPVLENGQFHRLRDFIYARSGIFFTENKRYLLETRLGRRIVELGLKSFDGYLNYVKAEGDDHEEIRQIYNAITINETFFFRFQAQLNAFRMRLLPDLIAARQAAKDLRLRIWSAACSSGEELYTVAMILQELLGGEHHRWKINLLGTDISQKAINKAKVARYTPNSFRGGMTEAQKGKFFTQEGNDYQLDKSIVSMARYEYLNLNDESRLKRLPQFDFIFCRNVMIYFDKAVKRRVIRSLYDGLNHGGCLFLGEAESIHGVSSAFAVEHFSGAFSYRKE